VAVVAVLQGRVALVGLVALVITPQLALTLVVAAVPVLVHPRLAVLVEPVRPRLARAVPMPTVVALVVLADLVQV
jgi:hypothetical protein